MKRAIVKVVFYEDGCLAGKIKGFGVNLYNDDSGKYDIKALIDGSVFFTNCRSEAEDYADDLNSGKYKI